MSWRSRIVPFGTRSSVRTTFPPRTSMYTYTRGRLARQAAVQQRRDDMAMVAAADAAVARIPRRAFQQLSATEVKSFDLSPANANLVLYSTPPTGAADLSGGICPLNCIQQGATFYNRIGTKIKMRSAFVRFTVVANLATQAAGTTVRAMLVYDRQPNGVYPAYTDILDVNDTGTPTMNASINMSNRSRFTVMRDESYTLDPAKQLSVCVKWFVPCALESEYGTSTGLIGDIRTGALLFVIFDDGQGYTGASYPVVRDFESRIRYLD